MRINFASIVLLIASPAFAAAQEQVAGPRASQRASQRAAVLEKVTLRTDVEYAKAGDISLKLDVYTPKVVSDTPLPCIVWIHGGGWQSGDKSSGVSRLGRWVASGDYVGVSVGYRLTDEACWPAQIHDCKAAIRYIRDNAKSLGINPDKIGIWGSSAGGHLVSLLGTSGDQTELDGDLGVTGVSSAVTCVVDYCGPSDFSRFANQNQRLSVPGQPIYKLFGGPLSENLEAAKQASPVTYVSKNDPPFLIVHGTADQTVPLDQAVSFHAAQEKAGMDTTLVQIEGGGHGIGGEEIEATVKAFLDKHLIAR